MTPGQGPRDARPSVLAHRQNRDERHADRDDEVLRFLSGERMKNASLCTRLGIAPRNAAQATAVLNRTLEASLIRVADRSSDLILLTRQQRPATLRDTRA